MGGFSVSNLYNSSGSYLSIPTDSSGLSPQDPLWLQLVYGVQQIGSILDPYVFTEQERAQMEMERLRLEAEREKVRQASIQVQPTTPPWVWALVAAGAVVVVLLLVNRE